MAGEANAEESDLDRISRLISEVEWAESLLVGIDPSPTLTPESEVALAALRARRAELEEELIEVWAKHCSQC
jgi:hypothetical protein